MLSSSILLLAKSYGTRYPFRGFLEQVFIDSSQKHELSSSLTRGTGLSPCSLCYRFDPFEAFLAFPIVLLRFSTRVLAHR